MPQGERAKRFFGITVLGDFVLSEGIDRVLDNLTEVAGATAVATNPTVTTEAPEGQGSFQPPSDAGSSPRLFDRPLFGKRGLWVQGAASYHPNEALYGDTPYRPRKANELTDSHGNLINDFIDAALDRGLKVYLQVSGATPSGLHDEDVPLLPNGNRPERMAETGCLASDAIRSYNRAYIRDLLEAYPQVTGFRPDWPEYPCYKLDEGFQDFNPKVKFWAEGRGYDYDAIHQEVGAFYDYLHGSLTNADLEDFAGADRGAFAQVRLLRRFSGVMAWLRLKSDLSVDLLRDWREAITEAGGEDKELSANAFMPPLTLLTGFDFHRAAEHCQAVSPKLYTMHWSVMVEFWGSVLLAHNPGLDEGLVVKALGNVFDLGDEIVVEKIADYGYPEPEEAHPIPNAPQTRRIDRVLSEAGGEMQVTALMHGYGPKEDFARRFKVVADSSVDGVWINRYGYLGDDKLEAVGDLWK